MLKVLIVEDEQLEREAINVILSSLNGFKVVGEATDGEEALARARELHPDIIFMDIRIGKIDGLEVSKIIKNELPDCEIIIITAYSRFDYSCQALRSGAFDFLLKPVEPRTLLDVANKVKQKIEYRRRETEEHNLLKENVGLLLAPFLMQDNLFLNNSRLKELEKLSKIFSLLGLVEGQPAVAAILHHFDPKLKEVMNKCLLELQSPRVKIITITSFEDKILFFLSWQGTGQEFDSLIPKTMEALVTSLNKLGLDSQIRIGVGQVYGQLNQLVRSLREAMVAVEAFKNEQQKVVFYRELKKSSKELLACSEELNNVSDLVQNNNLSQALERVQGLVVKYMNETNRDISEDLQFLAYEIVLFAMHSVNNHGVRKGNLEKLKPVWHNQWKRCRYLPELLSWLYGVLKQMQEMLLRHEDINDERVLQAIEYMEEHYAEDLSLTSVARAINISPQYLSRLFKTKAKATFTDYLNGIRIDRAKNLLQNYSYPIKRIAADIGYSSDIYFTYVFKKMTGMTPKEYRLQKKSHL